MFDSEPTEIQLHIDLECQKLQADGARCEWSGNLTVTGYAPGTEAHFEWTCPDCKISRVDSTDLPEGIFDEDTDRFLER